MGLKHPQSPQQQIVVNFDIVLVNNFRRGRSCDQFQLPLSF